MLCGVVLCWEIHYFPFSYCPFLVWVRRCSLLLEACMQVFCIPELSLGHVRANVYFTVYLMCAVSKLLGLSQDLFFSAIVGSCTLKSLILLADGLPSLVTETILVRMWNSSPRRLCTPCISSCSVSLSGRLCSIRLNFRDWMSSISDISCRILYWSLLEPRSLIGCAPALLLVTGLSTASRV